MKDVNYLKNNGINVEQGLEILGDMEMYNDTLNDFLTESEERLPKIKNYNPILKDNHYICNIDNNLIYIDIEDLEKLISKNYHIENGYVVHTTRIDKNKKVVTYLQREILSGGCIGFKNGNKLDLRKENLYVRY